MTIEKARCNSEFEFRTPQSSLLEYYGTEELASGSWSTVTLLLLPPPAPLLTSTSHTGRPHACVQTIQLCEFLLQTASAYSLLGPQACTGNVVCSWEDGARDNRAHTTQTWKEDQIHVCGEF